MSELKQDLTQKAELSAMLMIELLFRDKPALVTQEQAALAAGRAFGDVDPVSTQPELVSFAVKKYTAHFKDADVPPQVLLAQGLEFDPDKLGPMELSQLWDVEEGEALIRSCRWKCFASDFLGGPAMDTKERCDMLMDWLEAVLELFPDCAAVWVPSAGKLLTPDQLRKGSVPREQRFVRTCVNARFFRISGTEGDMVVDTLGMYAAGLPDVQLHFRSLDPNAVVHYAYNVCLYNYDQNAPIKGGDTIDGLSGGAMSQSARWRCQYEDALIQPARPVMDIEPGEYAAGVR